LLKVSGPHFSQVVADNYYLQAEDEDSDVTDHPQESDEDDYWEDDDLKLVGKENEEVDDETFGRYCPVQLSHTPSNDLVSEKVLAPSESCPQSPVAENTRKTLSPVNIVKAGPTLSQDGFAWVENKT
jgi:hypothetical protein